MTLIRGVGNNDAGYVTTKYEYTDSGRSKKRVWICPYYSRWINMLDRCYGKHNKSCYEDCTVCEEWLTFSTFSIWMSSQDWEGKQLDKDLLLKDNKMYSPTTCIFIDSYINTFIADIHKNEGLHLKGVWYDKVRDNYQAGIRDYKEGISVKRMIGRYDNELDAHNAWVKEKKNKMIEIIKQQKDNKVANALFQILQEIK